MTVEWAPLVTGIQSQLEAVIPVILPVAGTILAIFVGWKIIKRFVR